MKGSGTISNGGFNSAVGYRSLSSITSGVSNTAIGYNAGANILAGSLNVFVGSNAGTNEVSGNSNTYVGYNAGTAGTTGANNTCIGDASCIGNTQGSGNTALGFTSGFNLVTGSTEDIIIGSQQTSGGLTTAKDTIEIGDSLQALSPSAYASLDIGNLLFGTGLASTTVVSTGSIGIGTTTPYSRLEVFGSDTASTSAFAVVNSASTTEFTVLDNGNATLAGNLIQNSDQRLKTNIVDLDGSSSLAAINALNPVTFNWIDPSKSSVPQYGLIAQDVQKIFPNLVSVTAPTTLTPDGTLSLNYIDLISPIVAAIQELDKEITSLASTVTGFAQSITSAIGNFGQVNAANELCVGSTCVTPAQFQAMVAAANQSASAPASPSSSPSAATDTPPVIQINGDNPATIQVGASYTDLGATITGPQADLNLGIQTYLNGTLESPITLDTSAAATDTIDYVVTGSQGFTSTSTRTVIVEPASAPPPSSAATSSSATSTSQ